MEQGEELDLRRAFQLVWSRRLLFVVLTGVTVLVAVVWSAVSRRVWEGSVVVRIGQVGQFGQAGQAGGNLVEPIPRAIERLKLWDFQTACLREAGVGASEKDPVARIYRKSLVVKPVPTDLLRITVRGYSPKQVGSLLQATVSQLGKAHQEQAEPTIRTLQEQANNTRQALEQAYPQLAELQRLAEAAKAKGSQFGESVYLAGLVATKQADIRAAEQQKLALQEQLSPTRTYPTSIFDPVRVAKEPASPRTGRNILLAVIAGVFLAVFLIIFWEAVRPVPQTLTEEPPAGPKLAPSAQRPPG